MSTLLFVYGTLKRGCSNHRYLAGQKFVALARTVPGFRLFDLGGYPGLAVSAEDTLGVAGEIWAVDEPGLRELDHFEGVHEGLYRRDVIQLQPPFADQTIHAYLPTLPVAGKTEIGTEWIE